MIPVVTPEVCGTIEEFRFLSEAAERVMLGDLPELPPHPMASNGRDRFACYAKPRHIRRRNKNSNEEPMVITIIGEDDN